VVYLAEKKDKRTRQQKFTCFYCSNEFVESNYYKSFGKFFNNIGRIPYCKQCIEKFYQYYFDKYTNEGCLNPEEKAVRRVCMAMDIYYTSVNFNSVMNKIKRDNVNISPMGQYMRTIGFTQYKDKSYDNTVSDDDKKELATSLVDVSGISNSKIDEKTREFFGAGFIDDDYEFLQREYNDWTARHECKTKAQEEVFKDICFNRLQNLKALRAGEDTKDITASFQKMLDSGKLQPKQNAGDTTADNQTFGTLIDKWENTRPLPEIDEELRDVDKIGFYIDTFFKGHTCKMLNIKNAFSNLYSSMMKKFTVNKPEYNLDEDDCDSEINFDSIFGDQSSDLPNE
jgi:hypothetical protein